MEFYFFAALGILGALGGVVLLAKSAKSKLADWRNQKPREIREKDFYYKKVVLKTRVLERGMVFKSSRQVWITSEVDSLSSHEIFVAVSQTDEVSVGLKEKEFSLKKLSSEFSEGSHRYEVIHPKVLSKGETTSYTLFEDVESKTNSPLSPWMSFQTPRRLDELRFENVFENTTGLKVWHKVLTASDEIVKEEVIQCDPVIGSVTFAINNVAPNEVHAIWWKYDETK